MYNENKELLQNTLRGVLQNLQAMFMEKDLKENDDPNVNSINISDPAQVVVVLICDGFRGICDQSDLMEYAREYLGFNDKCMHGFT